MQLPTDRVVAGRYRVLGVLGRGGMAVVHEAHDQVLDRRVALKVLAGHLLDDDRSVQRFEREARAAAGLNHPNVVAVHDAASDGDVHFLVMELVEGRSLSDRLRDDGPLEVDAALAMADQVAAALGAAHDRGLVHRDVKPSNILLTGAGGVKVADFGIARAVSSEATQTAVVMGSVPYVAPEQLQGEPGADPRSDLYALGCVLYECLAGQPPFVADTSAAVLGQHLHLDPPPVSRARPEVGPHVDALVASLLAKDAADRPADAADLRERLARVRSGRAPVAGAAAAGAAAGAETGVDRSAPTEVVGTAGDPSGIDRHAPTEVVGSAATSAANPPTARLDDDAPVRRNTSTGIATSPSTDRGRGRTVLLALLALALIALVVWALVGQPDAAPDPLVSETPAATEGEPTTSASTEPETVAPTEATSAPVVPTEASPTPAPSPTPTPAQSPTPTPTPEPTPTPAPTTPGPASSTPDDAIVSLRQLLARAVDNGQASQDAATTLGQRVDEVAARVAGDEDDRVAKIDEEIATTRDEVTTQVDDGMNPGLGQQLQSGLDDLAATIDRPGKT